MPSKYISPWPNADAQRRQAMASGRNTWKQPEPPPKPKPRQYFVLGMEVDYNTYRKYNFEKTWPLDGDVLKGVQTSLMMLEYYAEEERAKDRPIQGANARKILDQIREEIATITGKDDKNMKTPRTAADFIDALNDIYTETRGQYAAINDGVAKAEKQLERAQEKASGGDSVAQARLAVAQADLSEAQDECRNAYRKMMDGYNARVKELRGQLADHLNKHYAASPDKLDAATMQLLGSGICTPDELLSLVERHQDCPTMVRVIGSYADKMIQDRGKMRHEDVAALQTVRGYATAAKNGDREMTIFDTAVSTAAYGLGEEYAHATRMHSHVTGWLDDFKNQIANLSLTPAAEATESGSNE